MARVRWPFATASSPSPSSSPSSSSSIGTDHGHKASLSRASVYKLYSRLKQQQQYPHSLCPAHTETITVKAICLFCPLSLSLSLLLISPYPCRSTVTSTSISRFNLCCSVAPLRRQRRRRRRHCHADNGANLACLPVCLFLCLPEGRKQMTVEFLSATTLATTTFYRYQNQENKCALERKRGRSKVLTILIQCSTSTTDTRVWCPESSFAALVITESEAHTAVRL